MGTVYDTSPYHSRVSVDLNEPPRHAPKSIVRFHKHAQLRRLNHCGEPHDRRPGCIRKPMNSSRCKRYCRHGRCRKSSHLPSCTPPDCRQKDTPTPAGPGPQPSGPRPVRHPAAGTGMRRWRFRWPNPSSCQRPLFCGASVPHHGWRRSRAWWTIRVQYRMIMSPTRISNAMRSEAVRQAARRACLRREQTGALNPRTAAGQGISLTVATRSALTATIRPTRRQVGDFRCHRCVRAGPS